MQNATEPAHTNRRLPRWAVPATLGLILIAFLLWKGSGKVIDHGITFVARRGPLDINVLEGGSLQALESQEIKCEVRVGYQGTKILKIVEEGYQVTEEDVKTNKVLVELDSSELQKQITQQEIQFQSATASLTDAQQGYDIQVNQNSSDIKAAEQKARFARMDFDKFLGDSATQQIVDQLGLEKELEDVNKAAAQRRVRQGRPDGQNPPRGTPLPSATALPITDGPKVIQLAASGGVGTSLNSAPIAVSNTAPGRITPINADKGNTTDQKNAAGNDADPKPEISKSVAVDFSKYARIEALGDGEAKQKIRKFDDDLQVAQKEMGQSQVTLEGTKRLFDKGFVTKTDLQRDEIASENSRLKVQTAQTARNLFLKYEFPKSAEEALSKYAEAVRELDRARKAAVSKLAQSDAKLKSAQAQYNVQLRQRNELNEQIDKCILYAKKPGLVVYGAGGEEMYYYGGEERIREGATVRERQAIITIPDMTKMCVKVKIHETYIKKVKKGQKVKIVVDAFADSPLEGEVSKVALLPDSQNRWMNPDMKVYLTTITINGTRDWIKPGMSAKAEIQVNRLSDVIYIPMQAVSTIEGKQYCYVASGKRQEKRQIEIGDFNDEFIEIKKGIKEGEVVCLKAPDAPEKEDGAKPNAAAEKPENQPSAPVPAR